MLSTFSKRDGKKIKRIHSIHVNLYNQHYQNRTVYPLIPKIISSCVMIIYCFSRHYWWSEKRTLLYNIMNITQLELKLYSERMKAVLSMKTWDLINFYFLCSCPYLVIFISRDVSFNRWPLYLHAIHQIKIIQIKYFTHI